MAWLLALLINLAWMSLPVSLPAADRLPEPMFLYRDGGEEQIPYSPSGWMGDWAAIQFDNSSRDLPRQGSNCMKITYGVLGEQKQGWGGIYWQRPANNWGDKDAGLDLTGARHLAFWARGAHGGEVIEKFAVGGIKGQFPDTTEVVIGPVTLTKDWKEYLIPLEGQDVSRIIGGFLWATSKRSNPRGCTFYLDHIRFE